MLCIKQKKKRIFIHFFSVGEGGLEPPNSSEDRFTVCCNCHYATPPSISFSRKLDLSRRRDLDPRPRDYKSRALPLSYAGNAITFRFASAKIQQILKPPNIFLIFFNFFEKYFSRCGLVLLQYLLKVCYHSENQ